MNDYFSINNPDSINMNYSRSFSNTISKNEEPNIVIIFLESVGANRLTALGNPLNATPNLDRIIENGILPQNKANKIKYESFADNEVQKLRSSINLYISGNKKQKENRNKPASGLA